MLPSRKLPVAGSANKMVGAKVRELASSSRMRERALRSAKAVTLAALLLPLVVVPAAGLSLGSTSLVGCKERPLTDSVTSPKRASEKLSLTVKDCVKRTSMPS